MNAEIIAIGDEIVGGQLLDTNSQWLSRRLAELGVRTLFHTAVADDLNACVEAFRLAANRVDVVITSGGLGPTADDLTREALAEAAGVELLISDAALEHVRSIFERRRRTMPARNERQGLLPVGAAMIHNPHGTAPGIDMIISRPGPPCIGSSDDASLPAANTDSSNTDSSNKTAKKATGRSAADSPPAPGAARFFALPGVPAELKEMWHGTVAESIRKMAGGERVICHRAIKCFGAGESQIEEMLPDLLRRGRRPSVGINASKTTIILRITAEGPTEQEALAATEPTARLIREKLGPLVFAEGADELQDVLLRLLRDRDATLATADWGTAGLLGEWLGAAAPTTAVYLGGTVIRDARGLSALGISGEPHSNSAGGEELARAMAEACRERFGADFVLSVGPAPLLPEEATDRSGSEVADAAAPVHLALCTPDGVLTRSHPDAGHPAVRRIFRAKAALNFLRLALLD